MFRLIFRILALFALAVAVVMAVIDATRSIAASALIITPLGESWYSVSPDTLNLSQALIQRYTFPVIWDPAIIYILTLPGWLVFAVLALLFHAIGYRRKRHAFS
ncbi:hypothetical protein JF546_09925 [Nitratireductor aquimarinus]|uniref:hypothetical protein n=1 Tax=Nitratireductor TaxID=245876 RepID=UPI000DDE2F72|nr:MULTISPECIES: hypothetical protein [Nitratireductor]MBY6023267.1 hypothetical protein [Nitratireductor sp. DP7N14-4]MBN7758474.1 hypothetical protein [Nitratireductor aquimarinus]MBN8243327.1 hypothetical protein [Nitratireductor aquimarinus]MBY6131228.1 hypothetical protein [Nitratireductor aquimarinus]MCA1302016.1 hypothetical protein [Nitratireductor aquimarinus]